MDDDTDRAPTDRDRIDRDSADRDSIEGDLTVGNSPGGNGSDRSAGRDGGDSNGTAGDGTDRGAGRHGRTDALGGRRSGAGDDVERGPLTSPQAGVEAPVQATGRGGRRSTLVHLVPDHGGPTVDEPSAGLGAIAVTRTAVGDGPEFSTDTGHAGRLPRPDDGTDHNTDTDPDPNADTDSAVGADHDTDRDGGPSRPGSDDWPWVAEWRAGNEPTPWATGLVLAAFSALVVAVAVWVLSAGLADRPVVAVLVNVLVAGGLAPAMWLSRDLPVLRWIAAGAAAGIVCGWAAALLMLPAPA